MGSRVLCSRYSSVSDTEYDQAFRKLLTIESEHPELIILDSPSQRVGAKPIDDYVKIEHSSKMLSLANAFNLDETYAFLKKQPKIFLLTLNYLNYLVSPNLMAWQFLSIIRMAC